MMGISLLSWRSAFDHPLLPVIESLSLKNPFFFVFKLRQSIKILVYIIIFMAMSYHKFVADLHNQIDEKRVLHTFTRAIKSC